MLETYHSWWKVSFVMEPTEPLCRDHAAIVLQSGLWVVDHPTIAALKSNEDVQIIRDTLVVEGVDKVSRELFAFITLNSILLRVKFHV